MCVNAKSIREKGDFGIYLPLLNNTHIQGELLCSPKAYNKPSLPPIKSVSFAMHGDESIMSMVGNSHVLLPVLISRPYMWESREPKKSVSSFIDMAGEDHILSPAMNSHAFSPLLQSKQYTFRSDAAKNTLFFDVAGELEMGLVICFSHLMDPSS